jgi:hypothetical protein
MIYIQRGEWAGDKGLSGAPQPNSFDKMFVQVVGAKRFYGD